MKEHEGDLTEFLRAEIDVKINRLLLPRTEFGDGNKYLFLYLPPSAIEKWQDRPLISGGAEPLVASENITVILLDKKEKEIREGKRRFLKATETVTIIPPIKNIQLHISPIGEKPGVRYIYSLVLPKEKPGELSYYIQNVFTDKNEPAPVMPFGANHFIASTSALQAFSRFLDEAKSEDNI